MSPLRQVTLITSPAIWERGHGPSHPLKPERLQRTHALFDAYGALAWENVSVVAPRMATDKELSLFHTREYIEAVRGLSNGDASIPAWRFNFGPGDNPVFPGMFETEGLKVGGALQAAEMLLRSERDIVFSYSGGLHHGGPDHASGFCVFNDAAVAIHWLIRQGLRVAYVDIDVHHGDGVQAAFYDTDQVLTISLHQDGRTLFPGTGSLGEVGSGAGRGFSVNLPLPPLTGDEHYVWAFQEIVPVLIARYAPDLLVTQLGVDTHYLDPLASLSLSTRGQAAIFDAFARFGLPWLALGGGGYNLDVVPRSWTLALARMAGRTLPDELPTTYQSLYGGERLHDQMAPSIDPGLERQVRSAVEANVSTLKYLHGLVER